MRRRERLGQRINQYVTEIFRTPGREPRATGPYSEWAQELAAERSRTVYNRDLYAGVTAWPLIQFQTTTDPDRVAKELLKIARLNQPKRRVVGWDSANAAIWLDDGGKMVPRFNPMEAENQETGERHVSVGVERWETLQQLVGLIETEEFPPSIFYLPDLHLVANDSGQTRGMVDILKRLHLGLRNRHSCIVIQTPHGIQLPAEVREIIPVVKEVPLSPNERESIVQRAISEVSGVTGRTPTPETLERITDAMVGLNALQVTQALQFALVNHFELDRMTPRLIQRFKEMQLAASGHWEPLDIDDVPQLVGWERLEEFVENHKRMDETLPPLVFVGHSGVGKTTAARRIGQLLGTKAYKADMARWMGSGIVGSLEQTFDAALTQARNAQPGVFLIDEFQRAIGGQASSNRSDSGSLNRGVSSLMQAIEESRQKEEPINWVLTANTLDEVPPEMLNRAIVFSIDFPDKRQRVGIFHAIMPRIRRNRPGLREDVDLSNEEIAAITEGMVGRDIEKLLRIAYTVGEGVISAESLQDAKEYIALQQDLDREEVSRRAERMRGIPTVGREERTTVVDDGEGEIRYPAPRSPLSSRERRSGGGRSAIEGEFTVVNVTDD